MTVGPRLGVDLGATRTKAVLALPDGRRLPVLPDGRSSMPSGVYVPADGPLVVGEAGQALGLDHPHRYVDNLAAQLLAGAVDVDGRTVDAVDLYAAVLHTLAAEAHRVAGQPVSCAALAVPAEWGPKRRRQLQEAARRAGLVDTSLVAAPTAVAAHHAAATGRQPADGSCTLVCDAGAAALRLTVMHHTPCGVEQLAAVTVAGGAGHDIDQSIAAHLLNGIDPPGRPARAPQWTRVVDAVRHAKSRGWPAQRR